MKYDDMIPPEKPRVPRPANLIRPATLTENGLSTLLFDIQCRRESLSLSAQSAILVHPHNLRAVFARDEIAALDELENAANRVLSLRDRL